MKLDIRWTPVAFLAIYVLWYSLFYKLSPTPEGITGLVFAVLATVTNMIVPGCYSRGLDGYALGSVYGGIALLYGVAVAVVSVVFIAFIPDYWLYDVFIQFVMLVAFLLMAKWVIGHDRDTLGRL